MGIFPTFVQLNNIFYLIDIKKIKQGEYHG
jgi:hypothetical protein